MAVSNASSVCNWWCVFSPSSIQVLTKEDCRSDRFLWELKMVEKSDAPLREKQM